MNRSSKAAICFLIPILLFSQTVASTENREQREMKMAEKSILSSIAVFKSPKGQNLCVREPLACAGADKAELALALIGARNSSLSVQTLIRLLRFRMDGVLSEDFECYVLKHAVLARTQLKALRPEDLVKHCHSEIQQLLTNDATSFQGLETASVCDDERSIQQRSKELIRAIDAGRKCDRDQF
jgi:Immunity protein 57